MVDDNPIKDGMIIDRYRVLGLTRRIPQLVDKLDIGVILFAIEKIQPDEQRRILELCQQTRARVVLVPDLMQMFSERLSQGSVTPPQAVGEVQAQPLPRATGAPGEI